MRVIVHQVDPHVARPDDPEDRIHVGSIEIEQGLLDRGSRLAISPIWGSNRPTVLGLVIMNTAVWSLSLALKSARSTSPRLSLLIVTASKPGEMGRGGIGSVGTVRDQDLRSAFASVAKISRRDQKRGQLALRAGRRLQADGVQTRNLRQDLLKIEENGQQSLKRALVLIRVLCAQAGQGRQSLVPLRVVLHRTRPERIEVGIDRHVER